MRNHKARFDCRRLPGFAVAMALVPGGAVLGGTREVEPQVAHQGEDQSQDQGQDWIRHLPVSLRRRPTCSHDLQRPHVAAPVTTRVGSCAATTPNGEESLQISLYTTGYSLREVSANAAGPTTKVSGIGNAASHFGTIVYVQRNSAPSFSVIDEISDLTLSQTEGIAKAIVG